MPLVAIGIPLLRVDIKERRLPNSLVALLAIIGVGTVVVALGAEAFVRSLIGGLLGGMIFLILYLLGRGRLGEGDVKLGMALSMVIFPISAQSWIFWLLMSFLGAGFYALLSLILKRKTTTDEMPYGPFLVVVSWITVLATQLIG